MELKENSKFSSEDILRVFSDITKDDENFSKISQNMKQVNLVIVISLL